MGGRRVFERREVDDTAAGAHVGCNFTIALLLHVELLSELEVKVGAQLLELLELGLCARCAPVRLEELSPLGGGGRRMNASSPVTGIRVSVCVCRPQAGERKMRGSRLLFSQLALLFCFSGRSRPFLGGARSGRALLFWEAATFLGDASLRPICFFPPPQAGSNPRHHL